MMITIILKTIARWCASHLLLLFICFLQKTEQNKTSARPAPSSFVVYESKKQAVENNNIFGIVIVLVLLVLSRAAAIALIFLLMSLSMGLFDLLKQLLKKKKLSP